MIGVRIEVPHGTNQELIEYHIEARLDEENNEDGKDVYYVDLHGKHRPSYRRAKYLCGFSETLLDKCEAS